MVKIRHTGIVTKNLKKSLLFWNKYLGFKILKEANEKGNLIDKIMQYKKVKVKTIKLLDKNGGLIEILYFKNSPKIKNNEIKPYSNGITHISITVKDIYKIYNVSIRKAHTFHFFSKYVSADYSKYKYATFKTRFAKATAMLSRVRKLPVSRAHKAKIFERTFTQLPCMVQKFHSQLTRRLQTSLLP